MDLSERINRIKLLYRIRRAAEKAGLRTGNNQGAMIRSLLGWRLALPEPERKQIATRAAAIRKHLSWKGTKASSIIPAEWSKETVEAITGFIATGNAAAKPFQLQLSAYERELDELAADLPAASFISSVRGLGNCFLWTMVGEAGDLSNYPDKSKLWKRLGLAVIGGKAQGKRLGDDAEGQGYNPARRSAIYRIGDSLIKGNRDGEYRAAYLARKAFEIAKPGMTKMHAHRRAQRYMEKRLIRDYWQAWRASVAAVAAQ